MGILREKDERFKVAAINALECIGKGAVAAAPLLIVLAQKDIGRLLTNSQVVSLRSEAIQLRTIE